MKRIISLFLVCLMLTGCGKQKPTEISAKDANRPSRFGAPTIITLSDEGCLVDRLDSGAEEDSVFMTHDIIYYEDRETYDSGNPYGEGTPKQRHTAEEAAAHTVVNITKPGSYRIQGKLSTGQIRVDLGEDAREDPDAVVELILDNVDITCTVAPAILFLNVYECDENRDEDNARPDVNTAKAGANLILEGKNTVNGSHVAKIFKDKDGEKKLWKQDAAIYSYMSMNVGGFGSLELNADNEGLDTELHLTINNGNIRICSENDGINTNEDNISVTTINGGNVTIYAGLGAEGDGIDSNGFLVINGGTVIASAHPTSDSGLDSTSGSFINGGTVIATGSTMDWAESNSSQVTMNLQFSSQQSAGSKITITDIKSTESISFETSGPYARNFSGLILSHPSFAQDATYHVFINDVQMGYSGTDVNPFGPDNWGEQPGSFDAENLPQETGPRQIPEDFHANSLPENPDSGQIPSDSMPENPNAGRIQEYAPSENIPAFFVPDPMQETFASENMPAFFGPRPMPENTSLENMPPFFGPPPMPEDMDSENMQTFFGPGRMGGRGLRPEEITVPENTESRESAKNSGNSEPSENPDSRKPPERPENTADSRNNTQILLLSAEFHMHDKVNTFSGVTPVK